MTEFRIAHELSKYYAPGEQPPADELVWGQDAGHGLCATAASPLRSALTAYAEVVARRLEVTATSVILTDGKTLHLLAHGTNRPVHELWLDRLDAQTDLWRRLTMKAKSDRPLGLLIPDLSQDERFMTLPFVMGPPYLRFYACAPIITKLDVSIGDLAVVDTRIRPQLSEQDRQFLNLMAKNCMSQLEIFREAELGRRGNRMNEGISSFVQSTATAAQALNETPYSKPTAKKTHSPGAGKEGKGTPLQKNSVSQEMLEKWAHASRLSTAAPAADGDDIGNVAGTVYHKTFRRAASILRTALGVEGVLFADGVVGLHGGLLPASEPVHELQREARKGSEETQTEGAETSGSPDRMGGWGHNSNAAMSSVPKLEGFGTTLDRTKRTFTSASYQKSVSTERPAEILGFSVRASMQQRRPCEPMVDLGCLSEGFLGQFLERHTEGEIFRYDAEGNTFRIEEHTLVSYDDPNGDARMLYSSFPGARQLIYSSLKDPVTQKRLAGCFAWSTRVVPVFTEEADLGPFKAFLHSVEAEVSRVDTVAAVEQREAFVSSVSHELRSPLHGILGAAELLNDTNIDSFQQELAHTIRSCGTALHETLSSVLAYAKINEFERKQNERRQKATRESSWALEEKETEAKEQRSNPWEHHMCTDIATLCEDVVEVIGSAHSYTTSAVGLVEYSNDRADKPTTDEPLEPTRKEGRADDFPILTLDIAYEQNWSLMTEPGALRRVMTNLIGNALKYSPRGVVHVSLNMEQSVNGEEKTADDGSPVQDVIFTVRDSGKGMSRHFIDNHLFLPFSQEDAIASSGVGLGMSIVKSLVSLLGGQIEVESQVGKGTEVKVTVPMTANRPRSRSASPTGSRLEQDVLALQHEHLDVAMLCFPTLIGESLQSYLTGWCNCRVLPKNAKTSSAGMIVVYQGRQQTFEDIYTCLEAYGPELPALIISPSSTKWKRTQISSQSQRFVHRILEPFGPNKITKALLTCLGRPRVLQRPERHGQETWSQNLADAKDLTEAGTQQSNELTAMNNEVSASEHRTRKVANPEDTRTGASSIAASRWKETQTADICLDTVTLPIDRKQVVRIPDPGDTTDAVIPPVSSATVRKNNKRSPGLLLVDDNEVNLKILTTFMEKNGYHDIETATNGLLAVRAVENRAGGFQVIIMDISMPIMDGLQATREIRRLEHERFDSSSSTAPAPRPALVVALTGLASAKEQKEAFRSGFNSFITKPLRFESLKEILAEWESGGLVGVAGGMEEGEGKEGKDSDALTARAGIQRQ